MKHFFSVAEHLFSISCSDGQLSDTLFYNYMPFRVDEASALLFQLRVVSGEVFADVESAVFSRLNDESPYIWSTRISGRDIYGFSHDAQGPRSLLDIDEKEGCAYLFFPEPVGVKELTIGLNNAVMLLYALFSSLHQTLLLHSSVVMNNGNGFAFLGESGTGKSTHSDLWVKHIPGSSILNDDNPVVRLFGDEVKIYGSPWSGKRNFYLNRTCPLKGLVMLEQAAANDMKRLLGADAFIALLTSCSCIRWKRDMSECVNDTIASVVNHCRVYHLQCRPDCEAARMCHAELNEQ